MTPITRPVSLVAGLPDELAALLRSVAADFPRLLPDNLVGIYLWGSLTYDAFDPGCSDVDAVAVTARDVSDAEFTALERWFAASAAQNTWTTRLDMRFVIDGELLDKRSRCCGFYSGTLVRHGSDANPIIWLNVAASGVALWGREARLVAPAVSDQQLGDALLLELDYLREDLATNAGDRTDGAFRHNAYAVLTACRIMYSAQHRVLASKEQAYKWALTAVPAEWHPVLTTAWRNRRANRGSTTPELERDALAFVHFVERGVRAALASHA